MNIVIWLEKIDPINKIKSPYCSVLLDFFKKKKIEVR